MASADHIINALGGSAAIARETGWPLTTIEGWKDANFIPEWRRPKLLEIAGKLEKALSTGDFPGKHERRSRAEEKSAA